MLIPALTSGEIPFVGVRLPALTSGGIAFVGIKLPPLYTGENQLLAFAFAPTGGIKVSGRADIINDPVIAEGGVSVSGSALVSEVFVTVFELNPLGGARVTGAAPNSFAWVHFVPSSGMCASGVAPIIVTRALVVAGTGGVQVSGTAEREKFQLVATGGMQVAGSGGVADFITVSGGVRVSGSAIIPDPALSFVATGGIKAGGTAPVASVSPIVPSSGASVSGAALVVAKFPLHVPSGGVVAQGSAQIIYLPTTAVLTPENPTNETFDGWAVNLDTNAASRYAGLAANSMCYFMGQTFVANEGGVYSLDGDTDAGQPVAAQVTFPESEYGTSKDKRIPNVYIGARTERAMKIQITTNTGAGAYYADIQNAGVVGGRANLGKGLRGRYWKMQVNNVEGADFELDRLEFDPAVSKRYGT